jgi:hypothetical protein
MEAERPGTDREPSRTLYCSDRICPVDGHLQAFLSNGGCIFCREGVCSVPPLILSAFSSAARPVPAETPEARQFTTS